MARAQRSAPICERFGLDPAKLRRLEPALKPADELAEVFALLGDPARAKILFALAHEELCVCEIAALLSLAVSTVSHHLRLLRTAHLVRFRKQGRMVWYRLADDHIVSLMRVAASHLGERAR